ncbi:MAG: copper transporter, partial [Actinomycetota bacterium]
MIDFRFHIISIVAVFLALGLGILMGSGFFGDVLVEDLKNRLADIRRTNHERESEIDDLQSRIEAEQAFIDEVQPELVGGALQGRSVVVFEIEGLDDSTMDGVVASIELAGGTVATTIRLSDKFGLHSAAEKDQLALIVRSTAADDDDLLRDAGFVLGTRAAGASDFRPPPEALEPGLEELLSELEDAGFAATDGSSDGPPVPAGALFLIVGGTGDEPLYDASELALALATGIAQREGPVLVAEPSSSEWGLVDAVRSDGRAREFVSTVDQAESVPGRIA